MDVVFCNGPKEGNPMLVMHDMPICARSRIDNHLIHIIFVLYY